MTWAPTKPGKQLCPECSHTRRNKRERCLSVTAKDGGFVWFCHNCNFTGGTPSDRETAPGLAGGSRHPIRFSGEARPFHRRAGGGQMACDPLPPRRGTGEPEIP